MPPQKTLSPNFSWWIEAWEKLPSASEPHSTAPQRCHNLQLYRSPLCWSQAAWKDLEWVHPTRSRNLGWRLASELSGNSLWWVGKSEQWPWRWDFSGVDRSWHRMIQFFPPSNIFQNLITYHRSNLRLNSLPILKKYYPSKSLNPYKFYLYFIDEFITRWCCFANQE